MPLVHGVTGKPVKEGLDQLEVIPDNRFWSKLEHRKFVRSAV
jgi:hypothetical protein